MQKVIHASHLAPKILRQLLGLVKFLLPWSDVFPVLLSKEKFTQRCYRIYSVRLPIFRQPQLLEQCASTAVQRVLCLHIKYLYRPTVFAEKQLLCTCVQHSFPLSLHFPRKLRVVRDFMGDFSSLYLLKNHMVAPRHMVEFVDTPCSFSSSWLCPLLPSQSDSKVDIILHAGNSKVLIFWGVTHCSRVEIYRR